MSKQIKSKQRVINHGEVFTNPREVNAMLDLVKNETERIESRFLEPACGNGNFLSEILKRKLNIVKNRYAKNDDDYEIYSILAVSSIYGVDILQDNARECRARLFDIWQTEYIKNTKKNLDEECKQTVLFILEKNILCGDALTMLKSDGEPIVFAEWSLVDKYNLKRRDYVLSKLLDGQTRQIDILNTGWKYDAEIGDYIPAPIKEYPITNYRRVKDNE